MNKWICLSVVLITLACRGNEDAEPWKNATTGYLKNPENLNDVAMYEPLDFGVPDTLSGDTAYSVIHRYQGLNIASREVRREARIYFDGAWNVLGYENIEYLDPMTKSQRKGEPADTL